MGEYMKGLLQRSGIAVCGLVLAAALFGCATTSKDVVLDAEGPAVARFSGELRGGVPRQGRLHFADSDAYFIGSFDREGFPAEGELVQHYMDEQGKRLSLRLSGRFSHSDQQLRFAGGFVIADAAGSVLAEADRSDWLTVYPDGQFLVSPHLFQLDGQVRYRQYRHSISPAKEPRQFVKIHRPLNGPFDVAVRYRNGKPRGVAVINAALRGGSYVVERQYFNYEIPQGGIHYFYFEPGSYQDIALLGGCERAPNLTAPQGLIHFYAYDCGAEQFLGMSEKYPATVIVVAAEDVDNSGYFHRLRLLHHGEERSMQIDKRALAQGDLVAAGLQLVWKYGELRRAFFMRDGQPAGVGIDAPKGVAPRYVSYAADSHGGVAPNEVSVEVWAQHFASMREALATAFARLPSSSASVDQYQSALNQTVHTAPPAQFMAHTRVDTIWREWQVDALSLIESGRWQARDGSGPARLQKALSARLDRLEEAGREILTSLAQRYCAEHGLELHGVRWACVALPQDAIARQCQIHFGTAQCDAMAEQLAGNTPRTLSISVRGGEAGAQE